MFKFSSGNKLHRSLKWSLGIVTVFIILTILSLLLNFWLNHKYQGQFFKGVSLAGLDLTGLTFEEAQTRVQKQVDFINKRGFVYTSEELKPIIIYPNVSSLNSADASYSLMTWEVEKSLQAIQTWQNKKDFTNLPSKIAALLGGKNFFLIYNWNKEKYAEILKDNFSSLLTTKQEATFSWQGENLVITTEQPGRTIDYKQALQETEKEIRNLMSRDINLVIKKDWPIITEKLINKNKNKILAMAQQGDIHLLYEAEDWLAPNSVWRTWLQLKKDKGHDDFYVGFDQVKVESYLQENNIKAAIEIPVQDAKFKLIEGRVGEFITSQNGITLKMAELLTDLEKAIDQRGDLKIALKTEVVEPKIKNKDVNDLGITEIIGTGVSDFKGSPPNRIYNIGVGAKSLNGVLIEPGKEFSLLQALGEIDGEHGYKEELVIKGNKTVPEFGGGLCQIGTTVFRAALGTGLPITARRNHSYRVVYYEPAGMDATIYNPAPDLKFINDTPNYILIQTHIEGVKLIFDFWGTSDGRVATTSQPIISNIVSPPEPKIIKTLDLPVGKEKCTESAHNGADAKFDYTVQYLGQAEPVKITFYSHYIPWQKVCLRGVTEEEWLAEQATSSTPPLIN
jgi:vancomycin resistance protein YoaR